MTSTSAPSLPRVCSHTPRCAPADSAARESARVIARHYEQGWSLLCNGVISFDDGGDILPNGRILAPHGPAAPRKALGAAA